jgi:hypothetical protein
MNLKDFIGVMGMTEITSIVTDVRKDVTKSGRQIGKAYYKVMLENGDVLFAWSFDKIKNIKRGESAKFLVDESPDGRFLSIQASESTNVVADEPWEDAEVVEEEPKEEYVPPKAYKPRAVVKELDPKAEYWEKRDSSIGRMSALNTAVAYLEYCSNLDKKASPVTEEDVIEIAKRFERYAKSGE